jgi:hypothetical protein
VPLWTPTSKPPPGATIDWGHPLARGLVGCWLFNEGSGIRVTNIASGVSGTLQAGGVPSSVPLFQGDLGVIVDPTISAQGISLSTGKTVAGAAQWSYAVDVKHHSLANAYAVIIATRATSGTNSGYVLYSNTAGGATGRLEQWVYSGGWNAFVSGTRPLEQWEKYAGTYDGAVHTLYRGGRFANSAAATSYTPGTALSVGCYTDGNNGINANIRYAHVWNRALTPNEVSWLAAEPYCMILPPVPDHVWWFTGGVEHAVTAAAQTVTAGAGSIWAAHGSTATGGTISASVGTGNAVHGSAATGQTVVGSTGALTAAYGAGATAATQTASSGSIWAAWAVGASAQTVTAAVGAYTDYTFVYRTVPVTTSFTKGVEVTGNYAA